MNLVFLVEHGFYKALIITLLLCKKTFLNLCVTKTKFNAFI